MQRKAIDISGQVQGVGFRPFVYRLASRLGLTGTVRNGPEGVHLEVQGEKGQLREFSRALLTEIPPLARISGLQEHQLEPVFGEEAFLITPTSGGTAHQALISPDVATCADCLRDLQDEQGRRYRYPFTNCTNCGPRYTITRQMPYDRPSTSMGCFPLCPVCAREYADPADRRFHAQPNACPVCGPRVWLVEADSVHSSEPQANSVAASACNSAGGVIPKVIVSDAEHCNDQANNSGSNAERSLAPSFGQIPARPKLEGDAALKQLARRLADGAIAAVKGLGGFHLVCDATNDEAVARLRQAKQRPDKPLAIMARSLEDAAHFVRLGPGEKRLLTSLERPIVLCPALGGQGYSDGLNGSANCSESASTRAVAGKSCDAKNTVAQEPRDTYCPEAQDPSALSANRQGEMTAGIESAGNETKRASVAPRLQGLSRLISPDTSFIGVMLPYTPLHHILLTDVNEICRQAGRGPAALVMTSGNRGGEPIALGNREALERLGGIADIFLLHDRDILIRTDDSVVRPLPEASLQPGDAPLMYLRRARGFVPAPLALPKLANMVDNRDTREAMEPKLERPAAHENLSKSAPNANEEVSPAPGSSAKIPTILALGAELKNTVCINRGDEAFVSQHIGDLQNLETSAFQAEIATHLAEVLQVLPSGLVLDAHPDFANQSAAQSGGWGSLPRLALQHHFAHAEAVLAENRESGPALVLALDGTGYSPTELNPGKSIWGGELIFAHPAANKLERIGVLSLVPLPGGEAAIRQPWRIAHGLLWQLGLFPPEESSQNKAGGLSANAFADQRNGISAVAQPGTAQSRAQTSAGPSSRSENDSNFASAGGQWQPPWLPGEEKAARLIPQMLERNLNSPMTSSAGRLFDAVAALLGLCLETSYEGQAAIRLEEAQYAAGFKPGDSLNSRLPLANTGISIPKVLEEAQGDMALLRLDTASLFAELYRATRQGAGPACLACAFHWALAEGLADLALAGSRLTGAKMVGLSGGVMQNMTLLLLLKDKLRQRGLTPLAHRSLPPNDGCISYGQMVWGLRNFR